MKKIIILSIAILTQISFTNAQKTVGGINMPAKMKVGKTELKLNGAGTREKFFMDMYACALYTKEATKTAKTVINADDHTSIKIHIISGLISSKKMTDAVEEGFENATGGKTEPLRKKIDAFKAVFSKEEIQKGDIYDIIYIPSKGTIVFKNGKVNPTIEGLEFKKALFAIWLGDKPADKDLKEELLGE